jgi:HrpA-like RNA helicase
MIEKKIGLFDPEGLKNNPLTGKPYQNLYKLGEALVDGKKVPTTYQFFAKNVWSNPLLDNINNAYDILDKLRNNQVLVIESATGTGKTVVLPKLAAHLFDYKRKVIVTVPKRSLAESNAEFCAKCMDVKLGEEVGFNYSESILTQKIEGEGDAEDIEVEIGSSNENSKIIFVTDGWLKNKLTDDKEMKSYGLIMIDEAHERNLNIDILLVYLREALLINPDLKVIVTSATLEEGLFENYFREKGISVASKKVSNDPKYTVDIINVKIKLTPQKLVDEVVNFYNDKFKNITDDVIIFINGGENPNNICKKIREKNKKIFCVVATAFSIENDKDLEDKAAKNPKEFELLKNIYEKEGYDRRVIIATDVWESSITLPLLKYVIDTGLSYTATYDGKDNSYSLLNKQIAKGQAIQRAGRVGRKSPGTCYRLYSKEVYEKMNYSKPIPIEHMDITSLLLDWWRREEVETLGELMKFVKNLITQPNINNVSIALKSLYALGFCTDWKDRNAELTELGYYLGDKKYNQPGDIKYIKTLYYANIYKCREEVSIILAALSRLKKGIPDMFLECKKDKKTVNDCKKKLGRFRNEYGDMIACYKAFTAYLQEEYNQKYFSWVKIAEWAKKNFLSFKDLDKVKKQAVKIGRVKYPTILFDESGEKLINFDKFDDKVAYCLLKGFYINLAKNNKSLFPDKSTTAEKNDIIKESSKKTENFANKTTQYFIFNKIQIFDNAKQFSDTLNIPDHILNLLTDFEKEIIL